MSPGHTWELTAALPEHQSWTATWVGNPIKDRPSGLRSHGGPDKGRGSRFSAQELQAHSVSSSTVVQSSTGCSEPAEATAAPDTSTRKMGFHRDCLSESHGPGENSPPPGRGPPDTLLGSAAAPTDPKLALALLAVHFTPSGSPLLPLSHPLLRVPPAVLLLRASHKRATELAARACI
ncbi:Hypothetical predicted protein [Marmota monax]|uniref:Uncharacterized protein n=1 Tax=Marmota monax TaxID=9995 RepID=A0A5E4A5X3_MARMO|nr:Hypothetical predicted protein [Marmota monax]